MDQQVAEKFAQALAEYAARPRNKQAFDFSRTNPYIAFPAISALAGGAAGYFSDDDEKKKLRNMLYGAGIGGLAGLGGAGLAHWYGSAKPPSEAISPSVSLNSPAITNDPAVQAAGGVDLAKPAGPTLVETAGKATSELANSGALADVGAAGLGAGAATGLMNAAGRATAARNFNPQKGTDAAFDKRPQAQRTMAENFSRLNSFREQLGKRTLSISDIYNALGVPTAAQSPDSQNSRPADRVRVKFKDRVPKAQSSWLTRIAPRSFPAKPVTTEDRRKALDKQIVREVNKVLTGRAKPKTLADVSAALETARAATEKRAPRYRAQDFPAGAAERYNAGGTTAAPKTMGRRVGRGALQTIGAAVAGSAMNSNRESLVARLSDILQRNFYSQSE